MTLFISPHFKYPKLAITFNSFALDQLKQLTNIHNIYNEMSGVKLLVQ